MIRYPSVKTLREITCVRGHDDPAGRALALRIRKVLDGRDTSCLQLQNGFHGGDGNLAKLCAIDKLLGNHGVEWISWECEKHEYANPGGFEYSNTGDTYAWTLVLVNGRFRVTSWGDMVEGHERQCRECLKRSREEMTC